MVTNGFKTLIHLLTVIGINLLGSIGYCQVVTLQANDFSKCFGGTTVANNPGGGIIITRTMAGVDAGCEAHPYGGNIPLDSLHSQIILTSDQCINNSYYVVTITFRNTAGAWAEADWIPDNGQCFTGLQVLPDVRRFAMDNNINGMTHYFIKIRVQPVQFSGPQPAVVFRQLAILPVSNDRAR